MQGANTLELQALPTPPPVAQYLLPRIGQVMRPHAPDGLHEMSHLHDEVHDVLWHAPAPVQLWVHWPVPHWRSPHAPLPEQVRSHAPVVQLTIWQAFGNPLPEAVQPTVQRAAPHETEPQAPSVPQVTMHDCALVQLTEVHAPEVGQLIVQFHPEGQDAEPPVPSIMQLRPMKLHDVHAVGHAGLSGAASSFTPGSMTQ